MTNMATRTADDDDEGRQMTMTNMAARMAADETTNTATGTANDDEHGHDDVR
jgi:hypothetical protein